MSLSPLTSSEDRFVGFRHYIKRAWHKVLGDTPLPMRLPLGLWWLASNDSIGDAIFTGAYERAERAVFMHLIRPGMVVFDVGAHEGLYTLIASRVVGPTGLVVAFEPSPRERKKLSRHIRINRCENVGIEGAALGASDGVTELFQIQGRETGCNSLRPPLVRDSVEQIRVEVCRLDSYLMAEGVERVDFLKMDVEGAEIEALHGAVGLLRGDTRPIIMCEVQDIRTAPWGYRASDIIRFLHDRGYLWFAPNSDGGLKSVSLGDDSYNGNFVAVPQERIHVIEPFTASGSNGQTVASVKPDDGQQGNISEVETLQGEDRPACRHSRPLHLRRPIAVKHDQPNEFPLSRNWCEGR